MDGTVVGVSILCSKGMNNPQLYVILKGPIAADTEGKQQDIQNECAMGTCGGRDSRRADEPAWTAD